MAKNKQGQVPGMVSGGPGGGPKGGPKGGTKGKAGRVSVASARKSSGDRTQLIIGAAALVVIIVVIAVGISMYSKNSATQGEGYGGSTKSVATVDDAGVVTVSNGDAALKLDIYEDALCPICADFEHQYGQQIAKALDDGQLVATYRMVDFLNGASFSGDYSTRAYAALLAVAKNDGSKPGVFMAFHTALYDAKNQPKENGSADLTNEQLGELAAKSGASEATQKEIAEGTDVKAASSNAQSNLATLRTAAEKVGRSPGTPTVVKDGLPIATNDVNWLTSLLPAAAQTDATTTSGN